MNKLNIIIFIFLLISCQKTKCNKFSFADIILEKIPEVGLEYEINSKTRMKIEVVEVVIDSTDYSIIAPFNYQECISLIGILYKIDDFELDVSLYKNESENKIFCSVNGLGLRDERTYQNEEIFLKSLYTIYRLNSINDTIMQIQMQGLEIKNVIIKNKIIKP
jgi:hypothetical protein